MTGEPHGVLTVTSDVPWQPEDKASLVAAIDRIQRELPGWWWSTGSCHITAHASIGPDRVGPDAELLKHTRFDDGFHSDLSRPSSCAEALNECIDLGVAARNAHFS